MKMPGSPTGGPGGPGATPMLSPGGGDGNKAAAVATIKGIMPALYKGMMAFEPGSKENQAILRALSALSPIFGKAEAANLVPAAMRQLAQAGPQPGGLASAPPPGIAAAPLPEELPPPAPGL